MKRALILALLLGLTALSLQAQSEKARPFLLGLKAGGPLAIGSIEAEYSIYKRLSVVAGGAFGYYGGMKYSFDFIFGAGGALKLYSGAMAVHFAPPWADFGTARGIYMPVGFRLFTNRAFQLSLEGALMFNRDGRGTYGGLGLHWAPGFNRD
ncbi:MAG: hypothetical protein ACPGLV_02575 [Bacteroidia bacterium]